jgi:hypothetical protein
MDHFVVEYKDPVIKDVRKKQHLLCFGAEEEHIAFPNLEGGQKVLITGIKRLYWKNKNKTAETITINLHLSGEPLGELFEKTPQHPDLHGKVTFVVPAHVNGEVPSEDQLIYEPSFFLLGFDAFAYLGMESAMLSPCDIQLGKEEADANFELFPTNHPLPAFLLQHKRSFLKNSGDIRKASNHDYYMVSRLTCALVRDFCSTALFPLFRYVHENEPLTCCCSTKQQEESNIIIVLIEIEYVVVSPRSRHFLTFGWTRKRIL